MGKINYVGLFICGGFGLSDAINEIWWSATINLVFAGLNLWCIVDDIRRVGNKTEEQE